MKKITMMALLAMVSWALMGTPAPAAETSHSSGASAGHHPKHHHKHKKHQKA